MANYATLKAAIQAVIYENGNQEITGEVMQATLLSMVNSLGANFQYAGIATPTTNPGTPDQNVFYLAATAGTYANFGNIVLGENEVAILKYNGAWVKDTTGLASAEKVNQLSQEVEVSDATVIQHAVLEKTRVNGTTMKISSLKTESTYYIPVKNGIEYILYYQIVSGNVRYGYVANVPAVGEVISNYANKTVQKGAITFIAPADGYFVASAVTLTDGYYMTFTTAKNDIGKDVFELKAGRERFSAAPIMEMGMINPVSWGLSYRFSETEVRTICGITLHLYPGDIVESDDENVEFLLMYKNTSTGAGTSYAGGWAKKNTIDVERYYVIKARFLNDAPIEMYNPSGVSQHIFITTSGKNELYRKSAELLDPYRNYHATVRTYAHRGYELGAPENTIPAFELARVHGYFGVEMDIQLTSDNVWVVIHNATVDSTSDGSGNVADMTLTELKALDFGAWFNPKYAGVKIPTLAEALLVCQRLGLYASIEIKVAMTEAQARDLLRIIRTCGMVGKVKLSAISDAWLRTIAAIDSSVPLTFVTNDYTSEKLANLIAIRAQYGNPVEMSTMEANDSAVIAECVANDVNLAWWVINDPYQMLQMLPGITSITGHGDIYGRIMWGNQQLGQLNPLGVAAD